MAIFTFLFACLMLNNPVAVWAQDEGASRSIFINITNSTEDLQKCSMVLAPVDKYLDAGSEVNIFLNVHAIELVAAEQDVLMYNDKQTIQDMVLWLVNGGASVLVSPMCLDNSEYTEEDLLPGIQVAGGDNFFLPLNDGVAVFSC